VAKLSGAIQTFYHIKENFTNCQTNVRIHNKKEDLIERESSDTGGTSKRSEAEIRKFNRQRVEIRHENRRRMKEDSSIGLSEQISEGRRQGEEREGYRAKRVERGHGIRDLAR